MPTALLRDVSVSIARQELIPAHRLTKLKTYAGQEYQRNNQFPEHFVYAPNLLLCDLKLTELVRFAVGTKCRLCFYARKTFDRVYSIGEDWLADAIHILYNIVLPETQSIFAVSLYERDGLSNYRIK